MAKRAKLPERKSVRAADSDERILRDAKLRIARNDLLAVISSNAPDKEKAAAKKEIDRITQEYLDWRAVEHTKRMIEALDNGLLPMGSRLVDPDNQENGVAVALTRDEAEQLAPSLRKVLAGRGK